jgi:hypothetical protein
MSIIDRIKELFGGKQSGADVANTGGAATATSGEDQPADTGSQSEWPGGGDSGSGGGDRGSSTG